MQAPRIGVYICECGINIAATVNVPEVVEMAASLPGVAIARSYKYTCSEPGQQMIQQDIREQGINRVVVASCTPRMHEPTFQRLLRESGLNPYYFEMANIREHVSWITKDPEAATEKAKRLVRSAVSRVAFHEPLEPRRHPGRALDRRIRLSRLPGRAGSDHRRPHGQAGQDVPHPGL
jgi:heterodisulfide reductase subunit A